MDDVTSKEDIVTDTTKGVEKTDARKRWLLLNKDRLAMYARNQYQKKVAEDPEYRKVLVQRSLARRKKMNEGKEPVMGRPKKEIVSPVEKKANGRPRKYPDRVSVSDTIPE